MLPLVLNHGHMTVHQQGLVIAEWTPSLASESRVETSFGVGESETRAGGPGGAWHGRREPCGPFGFRARRSRDRAGGREDAADESAGPAGHAVTAVSVAIQHEDV